MCLKFKITILLHYLQNKIQKKESQDNVKISLDASTVKV